jgi:hypothetical protein
MKECLQPRYMTPGERCCPGLLVCRARKPYCEADALREETGTCSEETLRGRGPSDCARNAGIKSGRAISQQGLAATCRDLSYKAES